MACLERQLARIKALGGQGINMGAQMYLFTERLSTCDAKSIFNQAALNFGICAVDNYNKELMEMTKHAFAVYAFCNQKRYLLVHLGKSRCMKPRTVISRLQELMFT